MKRISLVIVDQDTQYLESLANYIRTSEFSSKFDLKLFSKIDALEKYLSNTAQVNILLCQADIFHNITNGNIELIIMLDETGQPNEAQHPVVFKYQSLAQIFTQVLSKYYERNGKKQKKVNRNGKTKVISVFSANGGTGKTTVGLNLAQQIAAQNYGVFYLNLELLNSSALILDEDEDPNVSAPILYYLKTNSSQLASKIEALKKSDAKIGADLLRLAPSAEEMMDLSAEETENLIKTLIELESYDYIVIDLDSTINPRVLASLGKSTYILWLLNNDKQSFHKAAALSEDLHSMLGDGELSSKIHFVLNRYLGKVAAEFLDYKLTIGAYLPYIPKWKEIKSGDQLLNERVFSDYTLKMFRELIESDRGAQG